MMPSVWPFILFLLSNQLLNHLHFNLLAVDNSASSQRSIPSLASSVIGRIRLSFFSAFLSSANRESSVTGRRTDFALLFISLGSRLPSACEDAWCASNWSATEVVAMPPGEDVRSWEMANRVCRRRFMISTGPTDPMVGLSLWTVNEKESTTVSYLHTWSFKSSKFKATYPCNSAAKSIETYLGVTYAARPNLIESLIQSFRKGMEPRSIPFKPLSLLTGVSRRLQKGWVAKEISIFETKG